MVKCPTCGKDVQNLNAHFGQNPDCDRQERERAPAARTQAETAGGGADMIFRNKFARRVNMDYARMRYKRFIDTGHCAVFHTCVIGWVELIMEMALDAAESATSVKEAIDAVARSVKEAKDVLTKFTTQDNRDRYLINTLKVPYVEPMPFNRSAPEELRKYAAKLSISQLIGRILQHDAKARKLIIAKSDEWMTGELHNVKADTYADISDGWISRSHQHLMRKATVAEIERKVIRIGVGIHTDGATFVNGIGTKKGEHKDEVTDGNILNLPLMMRHSYAYLLLLSIVNSKFLKEKGGVEWSFCGIDAAGKESVKDSLAAELRQCEFPVQLPDDVDLTADPIEYTMQIHFIILEGDWLAAASMGYTPESTSSTHPCGDCMWVSKAARKRGRDADPEPAPRTHADLAATAARLLASNLTKAALYDEMTAAGINSLSCVLQPDRIPGADSVEMKPPDIMHLFGAGVTRTEGSSSLEILFKPRKAGTELCVADPWAKLDANMKALNNKLPRGKRISKLYPQRKGKKISDQHLDLNASEAMLYAVHSPTLVDPILTDRGRKHPCWISWLAHVAVVQKALQHVFTDAEVDELTTLISAHEDAFDRVAEYVGLERPKHHFQKHLAKALRNYGPFRGFWCMPFESFIQVRSPPLPRRLRCLAPPRRLPGASMEGRRSLCACGA